MPKFVIEFEFMDADSNDKWIPQTSYITAKNEAEAIRKCREEHCLNMAGVSYRKMVVKERPEMER